jgi:hypothetical protein
MARLGHAVPAAAMGTPAAAEVLDAICRGTVNL